MTDAAEQVDARLINLSPRTCAAPSSPPGTGPLARAASPRCSLGANGGGSGATLSLP